MRDSFIFYRSWYEAIESFPAEVKGEIYTAIFEYSLYGNETHDMGKIASAVWTLIRPQVDANRARYENGCKGGAPKGNTNAKGRRRPRNNLDTTGKQPNVYVNVNENDNDSPPYPPVGGERERVCDSDSALQTQNPYPSLHPLAVSSLQHFVCKELEKYIASKALNGKIINTIQQENIIQVLFPYEPAEQMKILKHNIDGDWKTFCIPDEVKNSRLARVKKQESERASKLALENWKKQTEEEPPCET